MEEKRTVKIETQANPTLSVQIRADLIEEFVSKATDKHGPFRSENESFDDALELAVEIAFSNFLKSGNRPADWD